MPNNPLISFHVLMFGSTLVLGVSISFLIQHPHTNQIAPKTPDSKRDTSEADPHLEESRLAYATASAMWTIASTLSIVLICQSVIAFLSRSLDDSDTLKISSRYVRLLPRLIVIAVAICLPIDQHFTAIGYLGILAPVCFLCLLWEWVASLEKGGGFMEP